MVAPLPLLMSPSWSGARWWNDPAAVAKVAGGKQRPSIGPEITLLPSGGFLDPFDKVVEVAVQLLKGKAGADQ